MNSVVLVQKCTVQWRGHRRFWEDAVIMCLLYHLMGILFCLSSQAHVLDPQRCVEASLVTIRIQQQEPNTLNLQGKHRFAGLHERAHLRFDACTWHHCAICHVGKLSFLQDLWRVFFLEKINMYLTNQLNKALK